MIRSIHPVQFVINFFSHQLCHGYYTYLRVRVCVCVCVCFMIPIHILAMIHGHILDSNCDYFYTILPVSGQILWFHSIHGLAKPINGSWDSVVVCLQGSGLHNRRNFRFPAVATYSFLLQTVQTGFAAHPASYSTCYRGLFSRSKMAVA